MGSKRCKDNFIVFGLGLHFFLLDMLQDSFCSVAIQDESHLTGFRAQQLGISEFNVDLVALMRVVGLVDHFDVRQVGVVLPPLDLRLPARAQHLTEVVDSPDIGVVERVYEVIRPVVRLLQVAEERAHDVAVPLLPPVLLVLQ